MSSPKLFDPKPNIVVPKKGYLPPHLKAKLPPKELTSEDIKSETLFPILSSSSAQKSPTIDFSHLLKETPVLPVVVKERTMSAWHFLSKIVVYDMDDEDFCASKKDPNFFSNIETPPIKKKQTFMSMIESYLVDDKPDHESDLDV
jgi:hypothetical protein